MAEEGNGDVGGDVGLPASRELVETKRKVRRFFWKHRRGEGWTLAAVELVGALGCSWSIAREREQRGIGTEGEIRESERVRGGRVASPGSSGGKQGGRGWPRRHRRSPPSCFVRWHGEEDGDAPGGLGRLGQQVSGLR